MDAASEVAWEQSVNQDDDGNVYINRLAGPCASRCLKLMGAVESLHHRHSTAS